MRELKQDLENFLQDLPADTLAERIAERCGTSIVEARDFIGVYANETRVALTLVEASLDPEMLILEVGAGLCLFSIFLKSRGYNVTALEPASGGFGTFLAAKGVIISHFSDIDLEVLEYPANCLKSHARRYDLIFSNNVIEHIPDLDAAWDGMVAVLAPGGLMIHNCPNYIVPYEPHLGIPVFKWVPTLSERVFHRAVSRHRELWNSLNFIGYFDVVRLARQSGLAVHFRRGLLFSACKRLGDDPMFRERHSGSFVMTLYRILEATGLLMLLRYVPAMLSTPMIFDCRK